MFITLGTLLQRTLSYFYLGLIGLLILLLPSVIGFLDQLFRLHPSWEAYTHLGFAKFEAAYDGWKESKKMTKYITDMETFPLYVNKDVLSFLNTSWFVGETRDDTIEERTRIDDVFFGRSAILVDPENEEIGKLLYVPYERKLILSKLAAIQVEVDSRIEIAKKRLPEFLESKKEYTRREVLVNNNLYSLNYGFNQSNGFTYCDSDEKFEECWTNFKTILAPRFLDNQAQAIRNEINSYGDAVEIALEILAKPNIRRRNKDTHMKKLINLGFSVPEYEKFEKPEKLVGVKFFLDAVIRGGFVTYYHYPKEIWAIEEPIYKNMENKDKYVPTNETKNRSESQLGLDGGLDNDITPVADVTPFYSDSESDLRGVQTFGMKKGGVHVMRRPVGMPINPTTEEESTTDEGDLTGEENEEINETIQAEDVKLVIEVNENESKEGENESKEEENINASKEENKDKINEENV